MEYEEENLVKRKRVSWAKKLTVSDGWWRWGQWGQELENSLIGYRELEHADIIKEKLKYETENEKFGATNQKKRITLKGNSPGQSKLERHITNSTKAAQRMSQNAWKELQWRIKNNLTYQWHSFQASQVLQRDNFSISCASLWKAQKIYIQTSSQNSQSHEIKSEVQSQMRPTLQSVLEKRWWHIFEW